MANSKHIISILLANNPGILTHVSGLFSARGYNIASLSVSPIRQEGLSRMTVVTVGHDKIASQIIVQLKKLVDVVDVRDISLTPHVQNEIVLMKVMVNYASATKIEKIAKLFCLSILVRSSKFWVLQKIDTSEHIDEFLCYLENEIKIIEIVRSGTVILGLEESPIGEGMY